MSSLMSMLYNVGADIADSPVRVSERKSAMMEGQEYRSREAQDARKAARERSIWTDKAFVEEGQRVLDEEKEKRNYDDRLENVSRDGSISSLQKRASRIGGTSSIFNPGVDDVRALGPQVNEGEKAEPQGGSPAEPRPAQSDRFSLFGDGGSGVQGGAKQKKPAPQAAPAQPSGPPSIFDANSPFSTASRPAEDAAPEPVSFTPNEDADNFSAGMAVTNPVLDKRDRAAWNAQKALEAYDKGDKAAYDYYAAKSDALEEEFMVEEKAAQQSMLDTFLLRLRPTAPEGSREYMQQAQERQGYMVQALQAMGPEAIRSIPPHIMEMLASDDPTDDDAGLLMLGSHLGLDLPEWAQDVSVDANGRLVYKDGLRYSVGDVGRTEEQREDDRITERGQSLTYDAAMAGHDNDAEGNRLRARELDIREDENTAKGDENAGLALSLRGVPDTVAAQEIKAETEFLGGVRDDLTKARKLGTAASRVEAYLDKHSLRKGFTGPDAWSTVIRSTSGRRHADRIQGMMEDMVAEMRQSGTGVFTDKDAERAQKRVASAVLEYDQLQDVIDQFQIAQDRQEEYYGFLTDWRNAYKRGSISDRGDGVSAEQVWGAYLDANPLFVETDEGAIVDNANILSFDDWEQAAGAEVFNDVLEQSLDSGELPQEKYDEIMKEIESGKSSAQVMDEYGFDWFAAAFGR